MAPFFSVLVPVYNVEKYLSQCIDSVLSQTYPDFELILVDDGSSDTSGKICDEYAAKDNRIVVIHQANHGHIMARHKAIKTSKGNYLLFLDSDDYWETNLLETIYNTISIYECDVVIFKLQRVSEKGMFISKSSALFSDSTIITSENKELLFKVIINGIELNNLVTKAVKHSIFNNIDYSQYYGIRNGEDLLQSLPILDKAQKILYLDHDLYNYRYNPSSITKNFDINRFKEISIVLGSVLSYLHKLGFDNLNNLNTFYSYVIKNYLYYIYFLLNSNIKYQKKVEILAEIRGISLYRDAVQGMKLIYLSFPYKMQFFLYENHFYMLLLTLCKVHAQLNKMKTLF